MPGVSRVPRVPGAPSTPSDGSTHCHYHPVAVLTVPQMLVLRNRELCYTIASLLAGWPIDRVERRS